MSVCVGMRACVCVWVGDIWMHRQSSSSNWCRQRRKSGGCGGSARREV